MQIFFFVKMQNTQVPIFPQYIILVQLLNFSSKIKKTGFFTNFIEFSMIAYISLHRSIMEFV